MQKNAVIICKGSFPRKEYPRYLLSSADLKVCCDGALVTLEKHGIVPDVVIGDMDSVCRRALGRFKGKVVHCTGQEDNDQTKAFDYIIGNCPDINHISIIAASGLREDHTIANLSLLMEYLPVCEVRGISLEMVSDYSTAFAIGDSCSIDVGAGRTVSIFSPDSTLRLRSEGLHWPTDAVVFDNWWKASLNRADTDSIKLTFNHPSRVLIILD